MLERGRPVGLLTAEQIVRTEHNPFVMSREIARAPDAGALAAPCRHGLPRLLLALVEAGLAPRDVSRVLTVQSDARDAAADRLRARASTGRRPCPWAWLALGSVARRELTLASDQDNALAYADGGGAAGRRALRRRRRRTSTRGSRRAASARTTPRCWRAARAGG